MIKATYVFCVAFVIAAVFSFFGKDVTDKPTVTNLLTYSQASIAPFLPEQYPTWYASWGEAAFTRINGRLKSVADTAVMQSGCSELESVNISEVQSQPPHSFVFTADCKSGSSHVRYYIDEQLNILNKRNYKF